MRKKNRVFSVTKPILLLNQSKMPAAKILKRFRNIQMYAVRDHFCTLHYQHHTKKSKNVLRGVDLSEDTFCHRYNRLNGSTCWNRTDRTNWLACAAVKTRISINYILGIAKADSTNRTLTFTASTRRTCIRNNICHSRHLLFFSSIHSITRFWVMQS